ncbi:MAG: RDD family protein [Cytophagales bacterium]|nr:MAG: RDD family protein [Cytophagales bacterium]
MNIQIETTQNVKITYQTADLGIRVLSYFIDLIICYSYLFLVYVLMYNLYYTNLLLNSSGLDDIEALTTLFYVITFLLTIPFLFYDFLCEYFLAGQSIGKKLLGLKVVSINGKETPINSYLIRWLFRIIENVFLLYGSIPLIAAAVSSKRQRLGDMVAGTTVVNIKAQNTSLKQIISNNTPAPTIQETYTPLFFQVTLLNGSQIALIKETIKEYKQNKNEEVINLLSQKIKNTLEIATLPQPMENIEFLKTIINDYHYFAEQK